MSGDRRDRMAEVFTAVADALQRAPAPVYQVAVGARSLDLPRPAYLPPVPPQTPAQYRAALARLGRLGIVKEA
jgi:hypothetical protein